MSSQGLLVWGLTHETHITPVYFVTEWDIRAILFEHFTSSSIPIFFNSKILKLHDLVTGENISQGNL